MNGPWPARHKSGDGVHIVNMSPRDWFPCAMCEKPGDHRHAVPWHCGPVLEGESQGGYKSVCPTCYDRWETWSHIVQQSHATAARCAWDDWRPARDIA